MIISNNSEGYTSTWPIVNVPDDYKQWYVENIKNSENAWYAPMNRSYAIKYAREKGYDYLVQLDGTTSFEFHFGAFLNLFHCNGVAAVAEH